MGRVQLWKGGNDELDVVKGHCNDIKSIHLLDGKETAISYFGTKQNKSNTSQSPLIGYLLVQSIFFFSYGNPE
jgi:hypothetical protein